MKKLFFILMSNMVVLLSPAQTWTGATNTNWNVPTNWNTGVVPISTSDVIVPGALVNYPVFSGHVAIGSINLQSGSQIDVNGFTLSLTPLTAYNYFINTIINNSGSSTDIVINVNSNSGYSTFIRASNFNDDMVFSATGSSNLTEGDFTGPNTYNGNVAFNINGDLLFTLSQLQPSVFSGNLSINRTVAGATNMFNAGPSIAGNFSFTNSDGGATNIGSITQQTIIGGQLMINFNYSTSDLFVFHGVKNLTTGGSFSVQGSRGFDLREDTLLLNSLSITGYADGVYGYLLDNHIDAPVTISDNGVTAGAYFTAIRSNYITGNCSFTHGINSIFNDADLANSTNTYLGNVAYTMNGFGPLNICTADTANYGGNVNIIRNAAGISNGFDKGGIVAGNFSYNNNSGGNFTLGNLTQMTAVSGTLDIQNNVSDSSLFHFLGFKNATSGGSLGVQGTRGFLVQNDSLMLTGFSIADYKDGQYGYLLDNRIDAPVTLSNNGYFNGNFFTAIRNNYITGDCNYTHGFNSIFYDANTSNSTNTYLGNVTYTINGPGGLNICTADTASYGADVNIIRTMAGLNDGFDKGGTIAGNFSYSNNSGGNFTLGNLTQITNITGTLNLQHFALDSTIFNLLGFKNSTTGGIVNVQGCRGFTVQNDSLQLASFSISDYKDGQYAYLLDNKIEAPVTLSNTGYQNGNYFTSIRNNFITGNCNFTHGFNSNFNDADISNSTNTYVGNVNYTMIGPGTLNIGNADTVNFGGHINIDRTVSGTTNGFDHGGTVGGSFTFNNLAGGNFTLGSLTKTTTVSDTVLINILNAEQGLFSLFSFTNLTSGGFIEVRNSRPFDVRNNSLLLDSIHITGYHGSNYGYLYNNSISGNLTLADSSLHAGGYFTALQNNMINGNSHFTSNGTNFFYGSNGAGSGNTYNGNLTCVRNDGSISLGSADTVNIYGHFTMNSASNLILDRIRFRGNSNSIITQLGTQALTIPRIIMAKSPTAQLVLNTSLTVSNNVALDSGVIKSSPSAPFTLEDIANYSGSSNNSFVNGPFNKIGNDAFVFPVGDSSFLAPIEISAPGLVTDQFTAQYNFVSPTAGGYDTSMKAVGINHLSRTEHWMLDRTAGSSNVFVTLHYKTEHSGPVTDQSDLRVARWNGTMWANEGNGGFSGTPAMGTVQSLSAVSNFSPFTLASATAANPLPVTLLNFNGLLHQKEVHLQWQTANEINFAYYEIERSNENSSFATVALQTAFNNGNLATYQLTDILQAPGVYFYRLKMVDKDRLFTYSPVIKIIYSIKPGIDIYPNPVKENLFITGANPGSQVRIISITGHVILSQRIMGGNYQNIQLPNMASGMYILELIDGDKKISKQFLKE